MEWTREEIDRFYDHEDWLQKAIAQKNRHLNVYLAASQQLFVQRLDKQLGTILAPFNITCHLN